NYLASVVDRATLKCYVSTDAICRFFCSDTLSYLIDKGVTQGRLKGLKLNRRCPTLTHVLFADNTILFGEASVTEAINIHKTIELYANLTGQTINNQKLAIMFSRHTPNALQDKISRGLGFQVNRTFGKYLGVPSEWGGSKKEVFRFLLTRMEAIGKSWKSQCMSHAGKETLLKAVYQSIPAYIMSCFLLPKDLTNKMDSRLWAFFWGGSMTKKTIHWTKGSILTKRKSEGGLGFKNFHLFNMALLAKQGWRLIQEKNQLWARLLKGMYFSNTDFLNAQKGKSPSWIWASLCDSRTILKLGARKNMVNGETIRVGVDPWIPKFENFKLSSSIPIDTTANEWLTDDKKKWNNEGLTSYCSPEEVTEILKNPIAPPPPPPPPLHPDQWVWHLDKHGTFSVKSAYHALRTATVDSHTDNLGYMSSKIWKWLWNILIPPKYSFFLWRVARNAIATNMNLTKRNCAPQPLCPLCQHHEETVNHCLFSSEVATEV
ncbi:Putative ribonuclease H protein At1g65750, partial [Linum perenne]